MSWKVFVGVGLHFELSSYWKAAQFAYQGNKLLDNLLVVDRLVECFGSYPASRTASPQGAQNLPCQSGCLNAGLLKKSCDTEWLAVIFLSRASDLFENVALVHIRTLVRWGIDTVGSMTTGFVLSGVVLL